MFAMLLVSHGAAGMTSEPLIAPHNRGNRAHMAPVWPVNRPAVCEKLGFGPLGKYWSQIVNKVIKYSQS